jgi:2,3-dihydroxy-p-cumate/2,3-dihydroxybenzoate 3,4-dioxygenase
MADLQDVRYARIGSEDLDTSVRFATEILGLELMERDARCAYLRGDDRDHNICYIKGRKSGQATGWEVASMDALDKAAAEFESAGVIVRLGTADERDQRRVRGLLVLNDATGNTIELVARPAACGRRYFPSRDAGISHFSHVGLHTKDAAADEAFWVGNLGAKVSDWIGDAALLRINEVHHNVALFPSTKSGIQHLNFQVLTQDDIMRSFYYLQKRNVKIVFGPGRHPTSGARFLYFQGPDDVIYEYSCGVRMITAEDEKTYVPRSFPKVSSSFCMWGSEPDIPEFRTSGSRNEAAVSSAT